jgi:hypothetical protein
VWRDPDRGARRQLAADDQHRPPARRSTSTHRRRPRSIHVVLGPVTVPIKRTAPAEPSTSSTTNRSPMVAFHVRQAPCTHSRRTPTDLGEQSQSYVPVPMLVLPRYHDPALASSAQSLILNTRNRLTGAIRILYASSSQAAQDYRELFAEQGRRWQADFLHDPDHDQPGGRQHLRRASAQGPRRHPRADPRNPGPHHGEDHGQKRPRTRHRGPARPRLPLTPELTVEPVGKPPRRAFQGDGFGVAYGGRTNASYTAVAILLLQ